MSWSFLEDRRQARAQNPGGKYGTATGKQWEDASLRMPPIYTQYSQPGITGLTAIENELSDPYRGIGAAEKALLDQNDALALGVGGGKASRLASLPGGASAGRGGLQSLRASRQMPDTLRAAAGQRGSMGVPARPSALPGNVQNTIGNIRAGDEREYALLSLLMGDERLRAYLFPYLSSYNQAVDIAGWQKPEEGKGSGTEDFLQAAGLILSIASIACWVAREVYGWPDPRWLMFRDWLLTKAPADFRVYYLKHGPRIARYIHDKPKWKRAIRRQMDAIVLWR